MHRSLPVLITALACLVGWPRAAHAYLDPSTGSMALSAVLSVLAALGMALQTYGQRLRAKLFPGARRRADRTRRPPPARG
jgi:hypothetical protein